MTGQKCSKMDHKIRIGMISHFKVKKISRAPKFNAKWAKSTS